MRDWRRAILAGALLLAAPVPRLSAQGAATATQNVVRAHISWRFDPARRCPDLQPAADDDGGAAVVLFHVGSTGVPSQASIRRSSQSAGLDQAAVDCVLKLRFQPATRLGDGLAVDSWQEIAWKSANRSAQPVQALPAPPTTGAAAVAALPAMAASAATVATASPPPAAGSTPARLMGDTAEVRACVDESGRLLAEPTIVHSSGDARIDAAAVNIARSGSGYYRPAAAAGGGPASGCVQLAVRFETR